MGEPITPYKGRKAEPIVAAALEQYEQGIEIDAIAKSLNVPSRSLYRWLASNAADQWKELQQARAQQDHEAARKARDQAAKELKDLKETLDTEEVNDAPERNWRLAHAREVLRAADQELSHQKWLLERLLSKIYGTDQPADNAGRVSISINLGTNQPLDVVAESGNGEVVRIENAQSKT